MKTCVLMKSNFQSLRQKIIMILNQLTTNNSFMNNALAGCSAHAGLSGPYAGFQVGWRSYLIKGTNQPHDEYTFQSCEL